jgi:CubicO group peptidase (beta-lactamase class C family)
MTESVRPGTKDRAAIMTSSIGIRRALQSGVRWSRAMIVHRATGTTAVLLACAVALAPGQREPLLNIEGFRAKIRKIVDDGKTTPSLAVAVAVGGRMVWSEGFGFADREARVSATSRTPYSIASVTKPFTATALMILVERQRLALDEPLGRFLGSLSRPGVASPGEVTLRRVLGHVGGFPIHYQYFFDDQPERPLSFEDTMRCYGSEVERPGSRYTYSNLGFGALGEAVARVSGQRYRDFLAREIFAPLGLTRASVPERAEEAAGAARRYGRDGRPIPFFVTDFPGGSAVHASVEDVARFGAFHAGTLMDGQRAVLTPASVRAMQQAGAGDYGLGWSINHTWNRHPVVWHSGAMPGSSATLWLVPAEQIAIAVVANQIGAPVNQLAGEILAGLTPSGQPAKESGAPGEARPTTPDQAPARAAVPERRYRGRLMTCPEPQALSIDFGASGEPGVVLGGEGARPLENVSLTGRRLSGTFSSSTGSSNSEYRLDLRVVGDRLAGPVARRTSLGPRANQLVTLWAELEPER